MNIIGFSGKKQSGKTTAINFLLQITDGKVFSFAAGLKEIVKKCFGATEENVNGTNEQKNIILSCGKTARVLMQLIGTDWFRDIWSDCWVHYLNVEISEKCGDDDLILIPDVRFLNEVNWIQQQGGHVIRLKRAPFVGQDEHESEIALDNFSGFDAIIDNRNMTIKEQNFDIRKVLTDFNWI